jgi:hypothetical protein
VQTTGGFTFKFGELVGFNSGSYFAVDTGKTISGLSGDVTAGYWDTPGEYGDNSGIQTLKFSVSGAPEPSTWAMMLLGFVGLSFAGYRAQRKSATASA